MGAHFFLRIVSVSYTHLDHILLLILIWACFAKAIFLALEDSLPFAHIEDLSLIHISDKSSGKRVQQIHIQYDGLGFIPLNELMKEETA